MLLGTFQLLVDPGVPEYLGVFRELTELARVRESERGV